MISFWEKGSPSLAYVYVCKQKAESEETEPQKPHVKLRRSISEAPRPASTPPTVAGGEREDGDEEKLASDLEVSTWENTRDVQQKCSCLWLMPVCQEDQMCLLYTRWALQLSHTHTPAHSLTGRRCEFRSLLFGLWPISLKWVSLWRVWSVLCDSGCD